MKRSFAALACVGLATLVLAQAPTPPAAKPKKDQPPEIVARAFKLVDGSGQVRGSFSLNGVGDPYLAMYANDGTQRVLVTVNGDGASLLNMYDKAGNVLVTASVTKDGDTTLARSEPKVVQQSKDKGKQNGLPAFFLGQFEKGFNHTYNLMAHSRKDCPNLGANSVAAEQIEDKKNDTWNWTYARFQDANGFFYYAYFCAQCCK